MKYDRTEIMKRAWEIKKQDSTYIFSLCLRMAWKEVKENKMEELTGTPKQVAWAEDIRASVLKKWHEFIQKRIEKPSKMWAVDELKRYEVWMLGHTSAKWWIDNGRHYSVVDMWQDLVDDFRNETM